MSDGVGGRTVPRAGVLSIVHVAVKTDEDLSTLRKGSKWVRHGRIAIGHVGQSTAIAAKVLDHDPVSVARCSGLVYPLLVGAPESRDTRSVAGT